jgi:hypothetical protein
MCQPGEKNNYNQTKNLQATFFSAPVSAKMTRRMARPQ